MKSLVKSKQKVSKQMILKIYLSVQTQGYRMMDKQTFVRVKNH